MEEQKENVREQAAEILENWKTLGWWDEEQTPEEQAALLQGATARTLTGGGRYGE